MTGTSPPPALMTKSLCLAGLVVLSGGLVCGAPLVTTSPPTAITTGSAMLHGMVNPDGAPVTAFFEYGTTTNYGGTVPVTLPSPGGAAPQEVSATVSRLFSGVTWHCRLTAITDSG